ncbi:Hypothetical predicted protein [Podarcis lilfordi]|uniref:Uncharacterized protein n=1 Tax=Podarcis lilfordi TaxID=74358 RepID=A0AA35LJB5_9SAUR|nr:Hypothetical predicted protein [Podarcis lilfordi]
MSLKGFDLHQIFPTCLPYLGGRWGRVTPGVTTEGGDKMVGDTHHGACSTPKLCFSPGSDAVAWVPAGSALPQNSPPAASPSAVGQLSGRRQADSSNALRSILPWLARSAGGCPHPWAQGTHAAPDTQLACSTAAYLQMS